MCCDAYEYEFALKLFFPNGGRVYNLRGDGYGSDNLMPVDVLQVVVCASGRIRGPVSKFNKESIRPPSEKAARNPGTRRFYDGKVFSMKHVMNNVLFL